MFGYYRITDEMREHMFDKWTDKDLQLMADDNDWTIPELKERLLEFAAFHQFDTLDSFLASHNGNNVNSISQLDGTPADCHTFDIEPQTPTMHSPMSQSSDDCESVFDASGPSLLATPSSQYTPARLKITEDGSPVKRGNNQHAQLMCQTDVPSADLTKPRDCDGSAIDANGQPIARIFDPERSLKHRAVPMTHLLAYNPDKNVIHLQGIEPCTGNVQADPHSLVISIEGVVCQDVQAEDVQAGAAVFFHPLSPWNTVTWVKTTKENAKLEALYVALNMIGFTAANDPNLKAVRIMCTGRDFCLANTAGEYSLTDRQAVGKWLQGADKTTLSEINELWTDITEGTNGHRAVDVRLWCVPEEVIRPVTDIATAYMYEQQGRDWYAENGKTRDRFEADSPDTPAHPRYDSIVAPRPVVSKGPQAVSKWTAEAKARLRQSLTHKMVASDGCRRLNDQLRASGELMSTEEFLEAYAMATKFTSEDPRKHIDRFVAGQRAIRQQDQRMTNGYGEGGEAGVEDSTGEKLVQEVLEIGMDWE